MRPPHKDDFPLDVEGVGHFIFGRRTVRDRFRIAAEYHRLTEGLDPGGTDFALAAEAHATLGTLLVEGPAAFVALLDLDRADPLDVEADASVVRVFLALRHKELSFRPRPHQAGEGARPGDGRQPGVLVPPPVQSAAD